MNFQDPSNFDNAGNPEDPKKPDNDKNSALVLPRTEGYLSEFTSLIEHKRAARSALLKFMQQSAPADWLASHPGEQYGMLFDAVGEQTKADGFLQIHNPNLLLASLDLEPESSNDNDLLKKALKTII